MSISTDNKNTMDGFDDYADTAEKLLLLQLYEKVINGELTTFSSLKKAVSKYRVSPGLRKCLFRVFALQRKLYWGFFKDVTPKKYPDLWRTLVIADQSFRFGGDLKRFMSIPDIYLGLLDIHGYTKYCHDKKRNMSMIDLLDRMIYEDVNAICFDSGVISKRAQGDEILLIGASASDVLNSVLQIMEYFNTQGRSFSNTVLSRKLPGTVLPKFQISAGIAGGQKFTPLIITRDGDISGDIVNTAARLQARANKISPDKNKIMLTNHVYQKLKLTETENREDIFRNIDFFNTGTVEFKGVSLNVYDVVFLPEEECRLKLVEPMENLHRSLEKKLWKSRVFIDSLDIASVAVKLLLEKGCKDTVAGRKFEDKCRNLLELYKSSGTMFNAMYYDAALRTYSMIVDELSEIDSIDKNILEYLQLVRNNYRILNGEYTKLLDEEVAIKLNEIYSPAEKENYLQIKKHSRMYEKVQASTRLKLKNRKKIWMSITDKLGDNLDVALQSLK